MSLKKNLGSRIRGWFPQEPIISKSSNRIVFEPLQFKTRVKRSYVLGLVGGIVTVLIAIGIIFIGLVFSGALRFLNTYASGTSEQTNQLISIQNYALGSVGILAAILGFVGISIGKRRGGILLVIASALVLVAFNFLGILPGILMLISGLMELGKQPIAQTPNYQKPSPIITRLKSSKNISNFVFALSSLSVFVFVYSYYFREFSFFPFEALFVLFFIFLAVRDMRRKHAIDNIFSKIFLLGALTIIFLTGILVNFYIINVIGYSLISVVAILVFTLLYGWVDRTAGTTNDSDTKIKRKPKVIRTVLVFVGIVFLIFALSLSSHVEPRLGSVNNHENIINRDFRLTQPIENITTSANLTTRDRLSIIIIVAHIVGLPSENSTADFTINYQSLPTSKPVSVFSKSNFSSLVPPMDVAMNYPVPQNGTYHFNVHYNYGGESMCEVSMAKYWSTNELLPTTIYVPLLGDYAYATLATSSILLLAGVAISLTNISIRKNNRNEINQQS